jgi:hypothetical protein
MNKDNYTNHWFYRPQHDKKHNDQIDANDSVAFLSYIKSRSENLGLGEIYTDTSYYI